MIAPKVFALREAAQEARGVLEHFRDDGSLDFLRHWRACAIWLEKRAAAIERGDDPQTAFDEKILGDAPEVMRRFHGSRPRPPGGITNAGAESDYEGVVFSDGTVVVRWLTVYSSHSVWACWDDFYQVHGHPKYGTVITWLDEG